MGNLTQKQTDQISKICEKKDIFYHQPERILREKKVDLEATPEFTQDVPDEQLKESYTQY